MATEIETIGLAMDTSGIQRGIKSLDDLAARGPKVEQSLQGVERAAKQASQGVGAISVGNAEGLEKMGAAGRTAAQGLDKMAQSARSAVSSPAALAEALGRLSKEEAKFVQSLTDEARQMGMTRGERAAYIAQSRGMSQSAQEIATAVGKKIDAYKAERAELDKLSKASEISAQSMAGIARTGVQAIVGSALLAGIKSVGQAMFEASAQAERFRTTLNFATGGNGVREIEYLRRITGELGLQFASTAQAYSGFQAAARGTALEGQKAKDVFESIAKASAVMGLSAEQSGGVLLALQQMISKGTVQAEELRGQLGERLPGSFQIAAKAMGVTTAELGKMLEQGQVVADDFLPKFAKALDESLGGAAEKAANRLDAATNKFNNAWERLKQNAGDSGASEVFAKGLSSGAGALDAMSIAMEKARRQGDGFWGQLGALSGAMYDLSVQSRRNLVNMHDNAEATKKAQEELARLQEIAATEGTSAWLLKEMGVVNRYIGTLQQARRERDDLENGAGAAPNPNASPAEDARLARHTREMQQRAKDLEAADAWRLNQAGVPPSYLKDMAELIRLNQAGVIVGKEYTDALAKQQDILLKKTATTGGAVKAANQEQNAYESLIASIRGKIEADKLELSGGAALTESQRIRIKLDQGLAAGRLKLSAQNERAVRLALEELAASEASVTAAKTLAKANTDAAKTRETYLKSLDTGLDKIRADITAQEDATARMGLSKQAIADLDAAKLEMLATDLELQAIKAMDRNLDEQTYSALKQQAEAYRELAKAKKAGAAKEMALNLEKANQEAAREAARDWERAAADINRSLTDALLRGFESGKSFAKNLRDTLKNMFSTLVLRPIISAVMAPVSGMVNGAVQGGMSALGGGSNIIGMAGNASSLYSGASSFNAGWFTNFGATLPGSIASTGAQLYSQGFDTLGNGLMDFGNSIAGYADALNVAGDVLGYGSAIFAAANGKWGQAIGSAVGTYFGGPIGSFVGSTIGKWADKIFSGGAGTPHMGAASSYSADAGLASNADIYAGLGFTDVRQYRAEVEGLTAPLAQAVGQTLDSFAAAFGKEAGYAVSTAFADDSSKDGAWGALRIMQGEKTVRDWGLTGGDDKWAGITFADGEKGQKEYLAAVAKDVRDVLASESPGWVDAMLQGLGDAVSMESLAAVVQQIGEAHAIFKSFGQYMPTFAGLADDSVSALVKASGGAAALAGSMGAFVENFYTDAEKLAINTENVRKAMADLGLTMPATRDEYKALVQAQLALGEAGAKTAAGLLQLSGAFASVTQSAEDAAQAAEDAAQAARQQASEQAQKSVDAAFANFKAAIERERTYWEDIEQASRQAVSALSGTLGLLTSNARELYGTVDSTAQMLAAQGMVYIEDALAAVRGGASAADYAGLNNAIGAARGGISSGVYASEFERQRDALVLAGQLSELGDLTDKQLTVEQRALAAAEEQIKQLDATLDYWQKQIDGTGQLIDVGLSIEGAIGQLSAALAQREAAKTAGGGGGGRPGAVDFNQGLQKQVAEAWNAGDWITAQNIIKGYGFSNDQLKEAFNLNYADLRYLYSHGYTNQNPGDYSFSAKTAEGVYAEAKAQGLTLAEVDGLINAPAGTAEEWAKQNGLPIFHQGTNYVPRTGLALLQEGEAVVPRTYNPAYGPGAVGQGNADLLAELRALRAEVAALRAPMEQTAQSTTQHATQFDNVTAGGNAMATEVFVV